MYNTFEKSELYPNQKDIKVNLNIKSRLSKELPADPLLVNTGRQIKEACYWYVTPRIPWEPSLIQASWEIHKNLGFSEEDLKIREFLSVFKGAKVLRNSI